MSVKECLIFMSIEYNLLQHREKKTSPNKKTQSQIPKSFSLEIVWEIRTGDLGNSHEVSLRNEGKVPRHKDADIFLVLKKLES